MFGLGETRRIVVLPATTLSPRELTMSFNVSVNDRLWLGVMQLITEAEADAKEAAEKSVANHGICASCVGGGEFLGRLRERMLIERENAIKMPPMEAKPHG